MVQWLGLRTPDAGPWAHPCSGDGVPHAVLKTPCATAKTRHPAWGFPEGPPTMVGIRVLSLVWEDPTCRRATQPMSHNS